jgi:hypothetical protein
MQSWRSRSSVMCQLVGYCMCVRVCGAACLFVLYVHACFRARMWRRFSACSRSASSRNMSSSRFRMASRDCKTHRASPGVHTVWPGTLCVVHACVCVCVRVCVCACTHVRVLVAARTCLFHNIPVRIASAAGVCPLHTRHLSPHQAEDAEQTATNLMVRPCKPLCSK